MAISNRSQFAAALIFLIPLLLSTSAGDGSAGALGGPTILIEEKTATWCAPCAEFDPLLAAFIADAGGRAVLASHHPFDGEDTLGSPASAHRLSRLGASSSTVTPTLWFDGNDGVTGPLTRNDLMRHVSSAEGARSSSSRITILSAATTLETTGVTVTLDSTAGGLNETTLTVMLVETDVVRPPGSVEGEPLGVVTRAVIEIDVVAGSSTVELPSGSWAFGGEVTSGLDLSTSLDPSWKHDSLGWVVVHERIVDGKVVEVLGAHASLPEAVEDEHLNSRWMVAACILLMAIGARIWLR